MTKRGIEHLHIYGIDNVLTRSLDPAFLGVCISNNAECGNKVVWRASKAEKVGVTGSVLGVDLADSLLELGRIKAGQNGLQNIEFHCGAAACKKVA